MKNLHMEISHKFPNKLIIKNFDSSSIDQTTIYITQVRKTVEKIKFIKTFFFLSELPDDFIDKITLEQLQLYGDIVNQVKYCAQLEIDKEQYESMSSKSYESEVKDYQQTYQENLNVIKSHINRFVVTMDHMEIYELVCMFPFLIDQSIMLDLIESEIQDSKLVSSMAQDSRISMTSEESLSSSSCSSDDSDYKAHR